MKSTSMIGFLFLVIIKCSLAQNSNPWPVTGNVGIGTATPNVLLHLVVPVSKFTTTFGGANIASFLSTNDSSAPFGLRTMVSGGTSTANRYVTLQTTEYNTVDGGNIILQPAAGYVGIGTTNPDATLSIQNPNSGWLMNLRTIAGGTGDINGIKLYSGFFGENKWSGISSVAEDIYSNQTGLALYSNNSEKVRIAFNGNVGIGTSAPASKLHIVGGGVFVNNYLGYRFDSGTGQIGDFNATGSAITLESEGSTTPMRFVTNTTERLRILSSGNVGIGTMSPDQLLTVNGTIHSKEVKVDVNIAPDYVFESDYKLRTLKEVQKYIAINKHLPEIPSAKNMELAGVNVSEMNMQLLKKVEELTLYLIQQQRINSSLQKQINKLANK